MSGKAIGTSFNYGFAGNVSRTPDCVIENKPVKSTSEPIKFGKAVVTGTDNTFVSPETTVLTLANFGGIAVAEVKQLTTYQVGQDQDQVGEYQAEQPCDVLKRGVASVKCVAGTPAPLTGVYVRKALNSSYPNEEIGDFRAEADGANTIDISTVACWETGNVDANDITELRLKTINN